MENCCLLLSANESYERAAQDIKILTGIEMSSSTQHRLLHRHTFEAPIVSEPIAEMSIDGGKVRLRTEFGQPCIWRDYKAANLHEQCAGAYFRDNQALTDWVNEQPLGTHVICLGDGHDGIWNLFSEIGETSQRVEILDWYHLMENLEKVGDSLEGKDNVKDILWQGDVESAIELLKDCNNKEGNNFIAYLRKHRHRIVNYNYYNLEGISIGSGQVESTVKQIARRIKISGAQWKAENVPQVLKHRCAYLNGAFST